MKNKKCTDCDKVKKIDNFYSNGKYYFSYCKKCHGLRSMKSFYGKYGTWQRNVPKFRKNVLKGDKKYQRRKRLENPEKKSKENYEYMRKYPERLKANKKLAYAVRKGRIKKSNNCEECMRKRKLKDIHGHHDNYSKPLIVRWLCPSCHKKAHRVED